MSGVQRFTYYTDGDYEYRIERGDDDSATQHLGKAGFRVWSLAQRPVVPRTIVIQDDRGAHDGSFRLRRSGRLQPPQNWWESCGRVYAPNDAEEEEQARRLLGSELLAGCTPATTALAAEARLRHNEKFGA